MIMCNSSYYDINIMVALGICYEKIYYCFSACVVIFFLMCSGIYIRACGKSSVQTSGNRNFVCGEPNYKETEVDGKPLLIKGPHQ